MNKPFVVECHGDSTTWGATLERHEPAIRRAYYGLVAVPPVRTCEEILRHRFGEVHCFSMGINQATSSDLLGPPGQWDARMQSSPAAVVCINVGMNDARQNVGVASYVDTMRQLVVGAVAAGKKVVVETANPVAVGKQPYGDAELLRRLERLMDGLMGLLREQPVVVCDHFTRVRQRPAWEDLIPDGVHPGPALYALRGQALADAVTPLLKSLRGG